MPERLLEPDRRAEALERSEAIDPVERHGPIRSTAFLSALLLFGVQPLIARFLLPWFGGTPAVWTTCLLFFQATLVAGYAYAHGARARPRRHRTLLVGSIAVMGLWAMAWHSPILPPPRWRPAGEVHPALRLLIILTASVGLPAVLLSATSPLLQAWYSRSTAGGSPWRFYAWSNLGSFAALIAYPVLVEPAMDLQTQAFCWGAAYLLFAAGCWRCAGHALGSAEPSDVDDSALTPEMDKRPPPSRYLAWLSLPACASLLLAATTNQMCQEVAPMPFLWILPLGLYLLSFIICFAGDRWYSRAIWGPALVLAIVAAYAVLLRGVSASFLSQVIVYPAMLFAAAMTCHGELFRMRPATRYLTAFYLTVAAGGALGGGFVALVAPNIFKGFWELHLGLWLTGLLALFILVSDRSSWLYVRVWPAAALLAGTLLLLIVPVDSGWTEIRDALDTMVRDRPAEWIVGAALVPLPFAVRWWRPGLMKRVVPWISGALVLVSLGVLGRLLFTNARESAEGVVAVSRNFYGAIKVEHIDAEDAGLDRYELTHGRISHGHQLRTAALSRVPTSYYTEGSGLGLAILNHPRRRATEGDRTLRLGVVGLGVGTTAAYVKAGDLIRFYEINPAVLRLSLGPNPVFRYLQDCPGRVEIAEGDARLSLERELQEGHPQNFDVLAIDAFSSDAIPVHLLTREAFTVYLRHLRAPTGILAVHISNRYLRLRPVVEAIAASLGLDPVVISDDGGQGSDPAASSSTWVLIAPNRQTLEIPAIAGVRSAPDASQRSVRPWTDAYSNLLSVVSWRERVD